jgi:hypothetical protein
VRFAIVAAATLVGMALLPSITAAQTPHLLIVVGLAGDPDHQELFNKWAGTLAAAAGKLGVSPENVVFLADKTDADPKLIRGRSTREEITAAFAALAKAAPEEPVFIVLIGHGSFDGKSAKFNLPGPDMAPEDFAALLKRLPSKQVVFVNTASASGPFVEALSGPGRTIVTATRTGAERFSTLFGGYFIEALGSEAADADKNGRVSVLEAFEYARGEVGRAYEREGLMATEHALLDDDGDGRAKGESGRKTSAPETDGKTAALLSLGRIGGGEPLPSDPRLRALHQERRDLERRVETLRLLKGSMEEARYTAEMEKALTELALKSREIRQIESKDR